MESIPKNIENLPIEMLERVFALLSPADLVTMGDVNPNFRAIIRENHRIRPENTRVIFKQLDGINRRIVLDSRTGFIVVCGFRMICRFIRVYSGKIRQITLNCDNSLKEHGSFIFSYVHYYLWNVEHILFAFLKQDLIHNSILAFSNAKSIWFMSCHLSRRLCDLRTMFPCVEDLRFHTHNTYANSHSLVVMYPHLKRIFFNEPVLADSLVELLKLLNPQINIIHPIM